MIVVGSFVCTHSNFSASLAYSDMVKLGRNCPNYFQISARRYKLFSFEHFSIVKFIPRKI